jgi:hypothetical protein
MTTIRPLTRADHAAAGRILCAAFADDPAIHWLLPDPRHRATVVGPLAAAYLQYAQDHGTAWCTHDVTGVALRRPPGREHLSWLGLVTSGMVLLPLQLGWDATQRLLQVEEHTSASDADGLPCYLETTHPRARAIHTGNGFQTVREARIDDSLTVWAMVRSAA